MRLRSPLGSGDSVMSWVESAAGVGSSSELIGLSLEGVREFFQGALVPLTDRVGLAIESSGDAGEGKTVEVVEADDLLVFRREALDGLEESAIVVAQGEPGAGPRAGVDGGVEVGHGEESLATEEPRDLMPGDDLYPCVKRSAPAAAEGMEFVEDDQGDVMGESGGIVDDAGFSAGRLLGAESGIGAGGLDQEVAGRAITLVSLRDLVGEELAGLGRPVGARGGWGVGTAHPRSLGQGWWLSSRLLGIEGR